MHTCTRPDTDKRRKREMLENTLYFCCCGFFFFFSLHLHSSSYVYFIIHVHRKQQAGARCTTWNGDTFNAYSQHATHKNAIRNPQHTNCTIEISIYMFANETHSCNMNILPINFVFVPWNIFCGDEERKKNNFQCASGKFIRLRRRSHCEWEMPI